MSFLNQKLDEDNALWTFIKESERESFNTRLAYNEKGGRNEPIQNYDDKVNKVKVTWSRQNDKKVSEEVLY